MPRGTQEQDLLLPLRLRGSHPLRPAFPEPFSFGSAASRLALQPRSASRPVWAAPLSLATTRGIVSSPPGTEMFQFPGFPALGYVLPQRRVSMTSRGFPHSDISG